ncbi:MAG: DUF4845 domain-containing protein [Proteobacteria bacterium]|nr:DUF4845 domain-containing protein [Pseudomonadota bacterium]
MNQNQIGGFMKPISQRQGGMTAIGIFLMMGILACFVTFGLRIFPLYNAYSGVISSMESVLNQPAERRKTIKAMRALFVKATGLNSVYYFDDNNVKIHLNLKKSKEKHTF